MGGQLIDGQWKTQDSFADEDGSFKRKDSAFRDWIGEASEKPEGVKTYPVEAGRYHLYVSYACPWAHRALIFRRLKGLEDLIDVSAVHPHMLEEGWSFDDDFPGATGDPLYGFHHLHQIYTKADPNYTGKVTVPVLWDKKEETIVNNESAEIIRIFNSAFNDVTGNRDDYYPDHLRHEIDAINKRIYNSVNNGVYKCGFAETQAAYDENIVPLFDTLDWIEERLSQDGPYLMGEDLTEADIRLFTTLVRFDPVYTVHFKCNIRQIKDYPRLHDYTRRIYTMNEVLPSVHFDHIKHHYYYSHSHINPYRIIPKGPSEEV